MTTRRPSTGTLIVFEGPDGAGKTTLVTRYADSLRGSGEVVTTLAFPGREPGSLGSVVYEIHHDPTKFGIRAITAESLQALHVAAHLDAIDRYIRPPLARGETVILDRYWWSTWVYGVDGGASRETIDALIECERRHWGSLTPDLVILVTRAESLKAEDGPAWSRRLALYRELSEHEQVRYPVRVIANDTTPDTALDHIVAAVDRARGERTISMPSPSTSDHR